MKAYSNFINNKNTKIPVAVLSCRFNLFFSYFGLKT